jgi:membrane-associated phospholipid phosphatase
MWFFCKLSLLVSGWWFMTGRYEHAADDGRQAPVTTAKRWQGPARLGRAIGLSLLALAAAVFCLIAFLVAGGGALVSFDHWLALWFHRHAPAGLTPCVIVFTNVNSVAAMSVFGVVLGVYFWRRKEGGWLRLAALAIPGGMVLNVLLKFLFERARPSFSDPLLTLATYSFPSGHTAAATVFYGIAAAYLARGGKRAGIAVAAALMVALVGLSRIYLGLHFFSDVLAAIAESCAWLTVCWMLVPARK